MEQLSLITQVAISDQTLEIRALEDLEEVLTMEVVFKASVISKIALLDKIQLRT